MILFGSNNVCNYYNFRHLEESLDALIIAEVVIDTKQREVNCGSHLTEQLSRRLARRFEMENMDAEEQEMSRKIEEPTLAVKEQINVPVWMKFFI